MTVSIYAYYKKAAYGGCLSSVCEKPPGADQYEVEHFHSLQALSDAIKKARCDMLVVCGDLDRDDALFLKEAAGGDCLGSTRIVVLSPMIGQSAGATFEDDTLFLCRQIRRRDLAAEMRTLIKSLSKSGKTLAIKVGGALTTIRLDDIVLLESEGRKVYIHTTERKLSVYGSLSSLSEMLDERFAQCHKSYIINMDYLDSASRFSVSLAGGSLSAPISQSCRKQTHEKLSRRLRLDGAIVSLT